ncbi:ABC transporter substrate-binding protein [Phytohabitans sp. ZYX-F-186]|uniref:ABC transporter substrate-binding protein n=1 Tax=Phytohabitans maris TaxID=3071409 RepID=A0ABU0ZG36_9ACTN|nr:ABC transporter substrate-binding protein [Phytohabitans sp. ZYX-F-186]MDQ7906018.1 ABC transporter substrate-binding protein [Phytohabitans sp. ZYX-F-186]
MNLVRRTSAAALAVLLAAVACDSGGAAPEDAPADKVTYLTAVGSFGRESYAWVAKEKGFFDRAGIEVEIRPGSGTTENLGLLASGRAQFSANDLSAVMIVLGNGKYRSDVRAVAAVQQRTLNSVTALSGTGVTTPRDLSGRTIGGVQGGAPWLLFPAYAKLAGLDPRTVKWIGVEASQMPKLLATGRVDGVGQFVVARPAVEKAAGGRAAVVLPYSDVLTDLYGNALIASTKVLREDPDLVRRFAGALMDGLVYAIEHPEETGQILRKYVPTTDAVTAAAEVRLMEPYIRANGVVGAFDGARVARAIAILRGTGIIAGDLPTADLVAFDFVSGQVR